MAFSLQRLEYAAIGNIAIYTQSVNQIPLLTEDEEQALARKWQEQGDYQAAKQLVMAHLRFVVRVARDYAGYGLAQADLIQEGNIGLMKAVKRFDPNVGVRLASFAVHWIKAEIHEFIIKNWRIVKIATTKAQRKLFFNLRKNKKRLGWFTQQEVSDVASDLGVTPKELLEMEARLSARDASFDVDESEDDAIALSQYLSQPNGDPADLIVGIEQKNNSYEQLHHTLGLLDCRSQDILASRWLADDKATLQELAAKYKVSAERIRQLEKQALLKLKNEMYNQNRNSDCS